MVPGALWMSPGVQFPLCFQSSAAVHWLGLGAGAQHGCRCWERK